MSSAPILNGSNYPYWKARMRVYLKSKDERVWLAVLNGWKAPTITSTIDNVPKTTITPADQWSPTDLELAKWNSKGLNAI